MNRKDWFYLLFILIVALVLRLDFLIASDFRIESDEAIVGLMAKHMLDGQGMPLFYYGQHYMGSFEPFLVYLGFEAFGPSNIVLKSVPLIFSLLLIVLVYILGRQISGKFVANLAALFAAIPPATLIVWSAKARGGFIELACFGALALILAIQFLKKDKHSYLPFIILGLVFGFAWWINFQIIYFMLPVGLFLLLKLFTLRVSVKKIILSILISKLSFLIGAIPFLIHNFNNNFASLEMFNRARVSKLSEHFTGFFDSALPILLGAKRFWHTEDLFLGSSILVFTIFLILLLVFFWNRRTKFSLKIDKQHGPELIFLFLLCTFAVFIFSSFGYLVEAPRYLLPSYIGVFLLSAYAISYLKKFIAYFFIILILLVNISSAYLGQRAIPGEPFIYKQQRASKDHTELLAWLDQNNYSWVRTNYWIGYRLAFESRERVRFLLFAKPGEARIDQYQDQGKKVGHTNMPLVLVPAQAEVVRTALQKLGYKYQETLLSDYVVIYNINTSQVHSEISNERVEIKSNFHPEALSAILDDDLTTRWGSAHPQNESMFLRFQFNTPQNVRGLSYNLGSWKTDYPRSLEIKALDSSGNEHFLLSPDDYKAILYYWDGDFNLKMFFDLSNVQEIHFNQLGSHPILDWSVAEMEFYQ